MFASLADVNGKKRCYSVRLTDGAGVDAPVGHLRVERIELMAGGPARWIKQWAVVPGYGSEHVHNTSATGQSLQFAAVDCPASPVTAEDCSEAGATCPGSEGNDTTCRAVPGAGLKCVYRWARIDACAYPDAHQHSSANAPATLLAELADDCAAVFGDHVEKNNDVSIFSAPGVAPVRNKQIDPHWRVQIAFRHANTDKVIGFRAYDLTTRPEFAFEELHAVNDNSPPPHGPQHGHDFNSHLAAGGTPTAWQMASFDSSGQALPGSLTAPAQEGSGLVICALLVRRGRRRGHRRDPRPAAARARRR